MLRNSAPSVMHRVASFWLLVGLLVVLWIAGGASRADAEGQVIVRLAGWTILVIALVRGGNVALKPIAPLVAILALAVLVPLVQLLPLPPQVWMALPSRDVLVPAAELTGQPQPWRPISISPAATVNALSALIIPVVVLWLAAALDRMQHRRLAAVLLALVLAGCLVGLLQFSGARFDNPVINEVKGFVAGNFANRNHLALFVSIGIVLTSVWGWGPARKALWKPLLALALLPFFIMIILATGSRSGLVIGSIATLCGVAIGRMGSFGELKRLQKWKTAALLAFVAAAVGLAVTLSVGMGRAEGIERLSLEAGEDLRVTALPIVQDMVAGYFPVGSGFGTFDPAFRMVEPDSVLRPQYFNHAHNDWLEIVLDGGLAGLGLLAAGVAWWLAASIKAWHSGGSDPDLARAGSTICLLIMISSITDYPARTPMIMAVLVIAAVWLAAGQPRAAGASRPRERQSRDDQKDSLPAHLADL